MSFRGMHQTWLIGRYPMYLPIDLLKAIKDLIEAEVSIALGEPVNGRSLALQSISQILRFRGRQPR